MDFRVFSRNISENMHARCVREDTKQALKGNLQADGVQSRQTLFVRYCHKAFSRQHHRAADLLPVGVERELLVEHRRVGHHLLLAAMMDDLLAADIFDDRAVAGGVR